MVLGASILRAGSEERAGRSGGCAVMCKTAERRCCAGGAGVRAAERTKQHEEGHCSTERDELRVDHPLDHLCVRRDANTELLTFSTFSHSGAGASEEALNVPERKTGGRSYAHPIGKWVGH